LHTAQGPGEQRYSVFHALLFTLVCTSCNPSPPSPLLAPRLLQHLEAIADSPAGEADPININVLFLHSSSTCHFPPPPLEPSANAVSPLPADSDEKVTSPHVSHLAALVLCISDAEVPLPRPGLSCLPSSPLHSYSSPSTCPAGWRPIPCWEWQIPICCFFIFCVLARQGFFQLWFGAFRHTNGSGQRLLVRHPQHIDNLDHSQTGMLYMVSRTNAECSQDNSA
jgi:hypothetical protein